MSVLVEHPVVAEHQGQSARHEPSEAIPPLVIASLGTTPYLFASWLEDRGTHPARVQLRHTEKESQGLTYRRRPGRSMPSPDARKIQMDLTGIVIRRTDSTYLDEPVPSSTIHHVTDAARLEAIQLGPDTCELTAECINPFLSGAFLDLLRDIARRWPEAAESVEVYLQSPGIRSAEGAEEISRPAVGTRDPRVPQRLPDFKRWHRIWKTIRPQVEIGAHYKDIAKWLLGTHSEIKASAELVADIAKAGAGGFLDSLPDDLSG